MSLSATCIAYERRIENPIAKLILIEMADYADDSGRTVFDVEDAMAFSAGTKKQVTEAFQYLASNEIIGLLEVDPKGRQVVFIGGCR